MNFSGEGPADAGRKKRDFNPDEVVSIALDICELMLENGAEVHRIEDTAERICLAYGAEKVEIFAITSLIAATITMKDGRDWTQTRRVYGSANNMYIVEKLNALSRTICRDTPEPERVKAEIEDIRKRRAMPLSLKYLGGLMGAFGFAMFFGGTVFDGIMAVVVGLVVCLMDFNRPKYLNQIACTALISAFAGVLITLISRFCGGWFPINTAVVSIAVIMLLIPGLALGNAVRDLLCGELVSGLVKMLQCILVAAAIAAGFTSVLIFTGGSTVPAPDAPGPAQTALYTGLFTFGFSMLFSVSFKRLFYTSLGGMLCISSYLAAIEFLSGTEFPIVFTASAVAGLFTTLYAEWMARVCKTPTTVFLITGLIPLVPGGSLYYTMAYLVEENSQLAMENGMKTIYTCLGLSVGIVLISVISQIFINGGMHAKQRIKRVQENRQKRKDSSV